VLQKGLLRRALLNTKEGGVVVYSTCTYAPEENEAVIASVKDQVEIDHVDVPGLLCSRGLTSWEGMEFGEEMTGCARFYPHQNDTGGFFVARLIKRKTEH
jgi:16S rRNA C967 or C1407 C5-methylase (RsmB/RsmF family)